MKQIYPSLGIAILLLGSLHPGKAMAQHLPGSFQPEPIYEGLRETLQTVGIPGKSKRGAVARPTEIRSRFIAKTLEVFDGASFYHFEDSLSIRWHDTAGAGYSYFNYIGSYYADQFIGFDTTSPRQIAESPFFLFDTVSHYPPSGAGFAASPRILTSQAVSPNDLVITTFTKEAVQSATRRTEHFYDAPGNRIATKNYNNISGGVAILSSIDSFFYDNNGNLLAWKSIDMSGSVPYIQSQWLYTYNSNKQLVQADIFNGNSTTLSLSNRTLYSYNTAGRRTDMIYQILNTSGTLEPVNWEGYTYNTTGQLIIRSKASQSAGVWDTTERVGYEYGIYDAPEVAYVLSGVGTSLDTVRKLRYFFNTDGLADSLILYTFQGAGQWYPNQKYSYLYTEFGQLKYMDSKKGWNNTTKTWHFIGYDYRTHHYHETFDTETGVNNITSALAFSIYPNPCSQGVLYIRSGAEAVQLLSVYDLSGRLLIREMTGNRKGDLALRLSTLAAGTYVLKVSGSKSSGSEMFVIR